MTDCTGYSLGIRSSTESPSFKNIMSYNMYLKDMIEEMSNRE